MAKILIAASPEPRQLVERMLAGHELCCAESMEQARESMCEGSYDLILCTLLFDESKMFDLLRHAKSKPKWQPVPFVCTRVKSHLQWSSITLKAVEFTCQAMGAAAFLDIDNYPTDTLREMRKAIERFLSATPGISSVLA
jgi:CheY-like chemotaxis protein